MYQFTDDCLIGIENIDEEHRTLFTLINEAAELPTEARTAKTVSQILSKLADYAATHFTHEEVYMTDHDDPELPLQIKEHQTFTDHVHALVSQPLTDENASAMLDEILAFLVRWLYRHILSSDMMIGKMESTDPFAFTPKYHTGVALIDEEHRRLFEIIRDTNALIHNDLLHDKYDEIMNLVNELRDYTEYHFNHEQEYMQKINYPQFDAQLRAHTAFMEKFTNITLEELDEIDNNQQEYLMQFIDFLSSWLVNHVLKMDTKIGEYARENL